MGRLPGIDFGQQASGIQEQAPRVSPSSASNGGALAELGQSLRTMSDYVIKSYQEGSAQKTLADAQSQLQGLAQTLKYGQEDENGERKMIPPDQHDEIYRKEVERIQKTAQKGLHGRGYQLFDGEFRSFADRQGLSVTANSIEMMHAESKVVTDENLHNFSNNFVNADNLEKPQVQKNAYDLVDRMVQNGVLTPEEGLSRKRKFIDDAQTGSFLKMVKQKDGPKAAILAIDSGEFKDLPADRQQVLRNMALNEEERQIRLANMKSDRAELLERRAEAKVNKDTAKDGYELMNKTNADGSPMLTPDWVVANRTNLSVEHYKFFLDVAAGRHEVTVPNHAVLADLTLRAASGEDVSQETVTQANNRAIRTQDLTHVLGIMTTQSSVIGAKNWQKNFTEEIKTAFGPLQGDDPATKVRAAQAISEWNSWLQENPKATREDAEKEKEAIKKSHLLLNFESLRSTYPLPRYLDETATGINLRGKIEPAQYQKAHDALKKAAATALELRNANKISESEFRREMARINKFSNAIPEPKAAAPTTTKR